MRTPAGLLSRPPSPPCPPLARPQRSRPEARPLKPPRQARPSLAGGPGPQPGWPRQPARPPASARGNCGTPLLTPASPPPSPPCQALVNNQPATTTTRCCCSMRPVSRSRALLCSSCHQQTCGARPSPRDWSLRGTRPAASQAGWLPPARTPHCVRGPCRAGRQRLGRQARAPARRLGRPRG